MERPTSSEFDIDDMNKWLQQLHDRNLEQREEGAVCVHPRLISYKDSKTKANWAGDGKGVEPYFAGAEKRDTFDAFWKANSHGAKLRVALCATWTESWVGKDEGQIRDMGWHCWGALVASRPKGYGKRVLIWDSDLVMPERSAGEPRPHAKDLQVQAQREFVKATKAAGVNIHSL